MRTTLKAISTCILLASISFMFVPEKTVTAENQPVTKHFSVYMNGKVTRLTTTKTTVEEALNEKGIVFYKKAMLPKPDSELLEGTKIFLLKKGEKFLFKDFAISDIPKEYINDPNLEYGTERELEAGFPGIDKVIYMVDEKGNQKEIGRIHKLAPKKALIHRGIKDCVMTEEGLKHYKRKFIANVTAYTIEDGNGDGVTSIGMVPYEGVVAVDPDFIPYKSKLFIPGYGLAIAGDTGGAIINNCIDLFMYDRDRAWQWGRRHIEVYVLDD